MTDGLHSRTPRFTRREALSLLGTSAAAVLSPGTIFGAQDPQFPAGAVIRTVLDDLSPAALAGGTTLFHEHMTHGLDWNARMAARPSRAGAPTPAPRRDPITGCPSGAWEGCANLGFMVEELARARRDGVVCIVDGTHPDGGRDIGFLTQMSTRSGMSIVASGGHYVDEMYPPEIATMSEEQITEELIRDATLNPLGAFGEMGTSDQITPNERKVFRAVGRAHLATNLPIFTLTANGKCAVAGRGRAPLVHEGRIYIVGGHTTRPGETKQVDPDILALSSGGQWEVVGTLPMPLSSPAAAIIDGKLYVAGGSPGDSIVQADMWVRRAP